MKNIVVAYDQLRTIGRDGGLPYKLPSDMQHFKQVTGGNNEEVETSVIMGRKTAETLPGMRPLSNRENIVITRMAGQALEELRIKLKGFRFASSLSEAYNIALYESYIIGGGEIYELALPTADRVFATEIRGDTQGGDVYFPELPFEEWKAVETEDHFPDARNNQYHSFITYIRRNPIF